MGTLTLFREPVLWARLTEKSRLLEAGSRAGMVGMFSPVQGVGLSLEDQHVVAVMRRRDPQNSHLIGGLAAVSLAQSDGLAM